MGAALQGLVEVWGALEDQCSSVDVIAFPPYISSIGNSETGSIICGPFWIWGYMLEALLVVALVEIG